MSQDSHQFDHLVEGFFQPAYLTHFIPVIHVSYCRPLFPHFLLHQNISSAGYNWLDCDYVCCSYNIQ